MPSSSACAVAAAALVGAASASASITVATDAERPALRVDARGNAEVSWTERGRRQFLLVPPAGRVYPGRRLARADVSRPSTAAAIPFRRVLRTTPDGRLWALQAWRVRPGGPLELRFSRWRGAVPMVTLTAELAFEGELLSGRATLRGRGVPLTSRTPEGRHLRTFVYLERFGGGSWRRVGGVAPRPNGMFRRLLEQGELGSRYRGILPGPNVDATLAPDVVSPVVPSGR